MKPWMKFRKPIAILLVLLVVGTLFYPLVHRIGPGGTGILDELTLDDGTVLKVVQRYNYNPTEPYTVDFFLKQPGGPWGWCYIGHEDSRWGDARLVLTSDKGFVNLYEGSLLRAQYSIAKKTFALHGEYQREIPAPQDWRNPPL